METRGINISAYRLAQLFFLLGAYLKQFYILPSGSFQMGDLCFMIAFLILFFVRNRARWELANGDGLIFAFIGCVFLINGIYTCIYGINYTADFKFHMSSVNYLYILFIILAFREFCEDQIFLNQLRLVLQMALLTQLVVYIFDLGGYYPGRFIGTFNDPNQCGFYLLSSLFIIFLASMMTQKGHPWLWFALAFYLIMETASTGMMLGLIVFLIFYLFTKMSAHNTRSALAFLIIAGCMLLIAMLMFSGIVELPKSITESFMYHRVMQKLESFGIGEESSSSGEMNNLIRDRAWQKAFIYPSKLLYGAGEGYFERLPDDGNISQEIHSSIIGPLFYYGLIPCMIWFAWIAYQLKGIRKEFWCVYIALLFESVTLVNNRQPFFWMIFVLAGSYLAKKEYDTESERITENRIRIPISSG